MKDFIEKNYLFVSDRDIANKFDVTVSAVRMARRRMGLKKDETLSLSFREHRRERARYPEPTNFNQFWNG